MKKHDDWNTDWIITVASSEADSVSVYRFRGTANEVIQKIVDLAKDDRERDEENYDYGCETMDDVDDISNGSGWLFTAYSTFGNYHIDYQAIQLCQIDTLK